LQDGEEVSLVNEASAHLRDCVNLALATAMERRDPVASVEAGSLASERDLSAGGEDEVEARPGDPDLDQAHRARNLDAPTDGHDAGSKPADVHARPGSLRLRE